jgi:U32 family peptidase
MTRARNKIELLAPAGNPEKLETAIHFGADAVYLAGKAFSLRNFSGNFTLEEMEAGITLARRHGVKVYAACNVYSRNSEQEALSAYLRELGRIGPDALIISDPGIFTAARELIPHIPVHISTQANTTNYRTAGFWRQMGARRINAARELSLAEIREIADRCPIEIEAFAHGAMCISYSGRCLLSSFMAGRDSNRGLCCHPCRFKYAVVEEKRPGLYYPILEDDRGSYIFNAKDLSMIEHIPEMIAAGVTSLKIEGRMKGIHYLGSVVRVYREAIDAYFKDPASYTTKSEWINELAKISHRRYCTGFYFGDPEQIRPNYEDCLYRRESQPYLFAGKLLEEMSPGRLRVEVRNKIEVGDTIELLSTRSGPPIPQKITSLLNAEGAPIPHAQPNTTAVLVLDSPWAPPCDPDDLIRKRLSGS